MRPLLRTMKRTPRKPLNEPHDAQSGGTAALLALAAPMLAKLRNPEFARLVDDIPFPLTYIDRGMVYRLVNRAYTATVGRRAEELLGQHISVAHDPARWSRHGPYYERALAGETLHYLRLVPWTPQGPRWLRTTYAPHVDSEGQVLGAYTVTVDVHELTVAHEQMQRNVERDGLTDAYSRRAMMDRLTAVESGEPMALYFIDLDGFKAVNDALGHGAGDELLVAVAHALRGAVRMQDSVGRFGGDEFLVLAKVNDLPGAATLAQHLLASVRGCRTGLPAPHDISASIGYALAPTDSTLPLELLRLADTAMYAAKRAGGNRCMPGSPALLA